MRKKLFLYLLLFSVVFVLTACGKNPTLEFENKDIKLEEGEKHDLKPIIKNLEGKDLVEYLPSDDKVVKVVGEKIEAVGVGSATITATLKDYKKASVTLSVTVTAKAITVSEVKITGAKDIVIGEELNLVSEVITNGTEKGVTWFGDNNSVATVDANGKVVALTEGTVNITATSKQDNTKNAKITIKVSPMAPTSVVINGSKDLTVGEEITLTAVVSPELAKQSVTWVSSDNKIATVDTNGKVKAIAEGSVVITATTEANSSVKVTVTIKVAPIKPTSLVINGSQDELTVGQNLTLTVSLTPDNAKPGVTWSSSNEEIAKVDANGKVVALSDGNVVITATSTVDENVKSTVTIKIVPIKPTSVIINGAQSEIFVGEEITLTAKVSPDIAKQDVIWESSNTNIITIGADGLLKAVGVGTATITVKSKVDSTITGTVEILVKQVPTTLSITGPNKAFIGETVDLVVTVTPTVEQLEYLFTSSNELVATVDANGKVSALKEGSVVITVKVVVNDEELTKAIEITITEKIVKALIGTKEYDTLLNAINAVKEGETITVLPGTHTDNYTINKSNVTIVGPNKNINPNTTNRQGEAILTGQITVASGVNKLIINGLAFTGTATIKGNGEITNVEFKNNYIFDTTPASSTWSVIRKEVPAFMSFYNADQYKFKGLLVENNKFSNVQETNISLARVTDILIKNNSFTNFDRDAIRLDGGFNTGYFKVEGNEFINDTLRGYNGIFFRIYGGNSTDGVHEIEVIKNTFKNIGQINSTQFSGAISASGFQEYDANIDISYNTFEYCTDYIHIRNNGLRPGYTWNAKAEYNAFIGQPKTYYYRNLNGTTDTPATNSQTMSFNYNYFEDNDGKPITDSEFLATKIFDVSSFTGFFTDKNEYLKSIGKGYDFIVSAEWNTLAQGEEVTVEGKKYIIGQNAFGSLQAAVDASSNGSIIFVLPGLYPENVSITKYDLTIITKNSYVDPNFDNRAAEAVFTGVISINDGSELITINGLAFTNLGQVVSHTGGVRNFTFIYNNFYESNIAAGDNGLLFFKTPGVTTYKQSYDFVITNNNFQANTNPRLIYIATVNNLIVLNNNFSTLNTVSADAIRVFKLSGNNPIIIENNKISNIYQFGIFIQNWDASEIRIIGNEFVNMTSNSIDIRPYTGTATAQNKAKVNVLYNTFTNAKSNAVRVDHTGDSSTSVVEINVNYNIFMDNQATKYFHTNVTGSAANLDYNYYNGIIPTADKFTGANSMAGTFTNIGDIPKYVKPDNIKPTSVQITSEKNDLDLFEEYQLEFVVFPSVATNKKVTFTSSDKSIATVNATGLVTGLKPGVVIITVTCVEDNSLIDTITFTVYDTERIEMTYEGNATLEAGEHVDISTTIIGIRVPESIQWITSNPNVAVVDQNGRVTAVGLGDVIITAKLINANIIAEVGFTVVDLNSVNELLKILIEANSGVVLLQDILYIGSDDGSKDYWYTVYGSVSNYFNDTISIVRNMITGRDTKMPSIEFITIHDTANTDSGALANSNYAVSNSSSVSWHYTVGNDGVYKQLEDNIRAAHASDGSRAFGLNDTGVKATTEKPKLTISVDGYWVLNGTKSTILAPTNNGVILPTSKIIETGIYTTIGENGNYYINNTWYYASYGGNIVNAGGNVNSIGIETAVNRGSDVYLTWQRTAKLVAQLLVEHNLGLDRLTHHKGFSGKPCPRTMITAGLWDQFAALVETEYLVQKNFSDYTIKFESLNPSIIDNKGRVVNAPEFTTNVKYKVTISKGDFSESVTLNALVKGKVNS